jgi:hypothetical protein
VRPPTYLSDHSQVVAWMDISVPIDIASSCDIQLSQLLNQFTWDNNSKTKFTQILNSAEIQTKLDKFINSDFTSDLDGTKKCITEFENIPLETSKKSLKRKRKKHRSKINNKAQKKWFDKDCRMQRHQLRKLANLKHKDPTNIELRANYHDTLKTYKQLLEQKCNLFHQKILEDLENARKDSNLFWKLLKNSSEDINNS